MAYKVGDPKYWGLDDAERIAEYEARQEQKEKHRWLAATVVGVLVGFAVIHFALRLYFGHFAMRTFN